MKRNLPLLLVLVALAVIAIVVRQGNQRALSGSPSGIKSRSLLLPDLPTDGTIRKLHIRESDKQVTVAIPKDKWIVVDRSDYPAAVDKIRRTVQSLAELKVAHAQPVSKEARGTVKLLTPDEGPADSSGLLVEMMNEKGAVVASFVAGKSIESTGGISAGGFNGPAEQRYVRVITDKDSTWLVGEGFSDIQPEGKDWVDKSFVEVEKVSSVNIVAPVPADSWGAERKDDKSEFTLMGAMAGDALDTAKAAGLDNMLAHPVFNDVLPKDKATPEFMTGAISAQITTFDGFKYDVKLVEKKDPKAKPGSMEAEPKDYISFNITADIAKERKADPKEKPEDKKKNDDAFAAEKKRLEQKLAKEKVLEGRVFEISNSYVPILTKKRSEVLRDKPHPPPTPEIKIPTPAPGAPTQPPPAPAPSTPPPPNPQPAPAPAPAEPKPATPPPAESKPAEPKPEGEKPPGN